MYLKVEQGIPRVLRIKTEGKERELLGNLFLVEVLFEDGTVSPLFEISLPPVELNRIDDLKKYVNKLWASGYFLSDWSSAIVTFLGPPSFPVLVGAPVFRNAGTSIFDGNLAMEKMNKMII